MGSPERRERDRLELRAKILDAAREIFVAEGYEAVTMRRVADRIEYSPAAIYFYFEDKKSLIRELVENDRKVLELELQRIAQVGDPIERIRKTGQAYIDFSQAYPRHYRLIFMTEWPTLPTEPVATPETLPKPETDGYELLRTAVLAAMESRRFKAEFKDPDLLVQSLWCGWHGVASLCVARGHVQSIPWRPARQLFKLTMDALIEGLLNRDGARPAAAPSATRATAPLVYASNRKHKPGPLSTQPVKP